MKNINKLDLTKFEFPKATNVDFAFPVFNTIPELLEEAKIRNFYYGNTEYNDLFSKLFFDGGRVVFKNNIDNEFKQRAWSYCLCLMRSFAPKHEHKEAVCAMIMSELLEPKLQ